MAIKAWKNKKLLRLQELGGLTTPTNPFSFSDNLEEISFIQVDKRLRDSE